LRIDILKTICISKLRYFLFSKFGNAKNIKNNSAYKDNIHHLNLIKIRNKAEFDNYIQKIDKSRYDFEHEVARKFLDSKSNLKGFCLVCNKDTEFQINEKNFDFSNPNFRDNLRCKWCNINNRRRFMLYYLASLINESDTVLDVYMYEQITPVFLYVKKNFSKINLTGSEFLGYDKKPGEIVHTIRNESALDLSFKDESFDIIISQDVYEHVPDITKALGEAFHVLKQGGKLLISIPLRWNQIRSMERAVLKNGKIIHIMPEEYHGNPLSKKGSLVFYNYGWDFLEMLKNAGFDDVYMLGYYSTKFGHIGRGFNFIFVAEKQ